MDNNHQEKLSLLQDLINLSRADEEVSVEEMQFIKSVADFYDITAEQLRKLQDNPVPFSPKKYETERIVQLYRLILLMGIDKKYTRSELNFCKKMGLKLGLNPNSVNEIIKRAKKSEYGSLDTDEILNIFQKHHN